MPEAGDLSAPVKRQEFPFRSGVCWAGCSISRACAPQRGCKHGETQHWPHTEVLGELCCTRSLHFHPLPHPHPQARAKLILWSLVRAVRPGAKGSSSIR